MRDGEADTLLKFSVYILFQKVYRVCGFRRGVVQISNPIICRKKRAMDRGIAISSSPGYTLQVLAARPTSQDLQLRAFRYYPAALDEKNFNQH